MARHDRDREEGRRPAGRLAGELLKLLEPKDSCALDCILQYALQPYEDAYNSSDPHVVVGQYVRDLLSQKGVTFSKRRKMLEAVKELPEVGSDVLGAIGGAIVHHSRHRYYLEMKIAGLPWREAALPNERAPRHATREAAFRSIAEARTFGPDWAAADYRVAIDRNPEGSKK